MLASLICLTLLAAPDRPDLAVPAGAEIRLDASIGAEEWADAFAVSREHPLGGRLHLAFKRTGPWLAVALRGEGAPYRGEVARFYVSDAAGSWISQLFLSVGQPHMPPALWKRAPPPVLRDPGYGPGECPRGCRVRLDLEGAEGWAAEYLIRLSALGIGRADRRDFRALVRVTVHEPEARDVIVLPGGAGDPFDPRRYARLVSADGWGADERWEPVPPGISREFDDHELLYRLFLEHDRISRRDDPDRLVIVTAVAPRSMTRINSLRRELESGRSRNPTLPAWTYFLGRLLHEANLYDEARVVIDAVPEPLRGFDAFVHLTAEHYLDTGEFQKCLDICQEHPQWQGRDDVVVAALKGRRAIAAEKEALERDAAKMERNPRVRFVTSKGAIVCELFEDDAPHAVRNFMDLVMKRQYYDGLRFHEIIGGRHAALGDPRTRPGSTEKSDGPAWRLRPDESPRPLLAGYLSAVPVGPDAYHGSQLIFALSPAVTWRFQNVFGRVVDGMDVLLSLEQDDRVRAVEVISKRNHAYDALQARFVQ